MRHGRVRQGSGRTRERMWKQARKKERGARGSKQGRQRCRKAKGFFRLSGPPDDEQRTARLARPHAMQCNAALRSLSLRPPAAHHMAAEMLLGLTNQRVRRACTLRCE